MTYNYIIKYTILSKSGSVLKDGEIKAKNKYNKLDAKIKLEIYLQKKHPDFGSLIIHSCTEENVFFDMFKDIFK